MKIKSLSVKNYAGYGSQEVKIDFDDFESITSVMGSNGVGKSSVFHSMIYTLYGKTIYNSIDDVVNRYIGKDCKTSLEFEINEDIYKIIRYRSSDVHKNNVYVFKNNKDISCKNASDTQQLILDLIKIPYTGFINSTFFSYETYESFLRARNSDRLNIFENLLNLSESNQIYDVAKKKVSALKEETTEINTQYSVVNNEIESSKNMIEDYKKNTKNTLLKLKKEKDENESLILNLKKALAELETLNIEEERKNIIEFNKKDEIQKKILSLTNEIKQVEIIDDKTKKLADLYSNYDWKELKEKYVLLQKKEKEAEEINRGIAEQSLLIDSNNKEIQKYNKEKKETEEKLASIQAAICPTCKQHINQEELERQRKEAEQKILTIEVSISNCNHIIESSNLKDLQKKLFEIGEEISALNEMPFKNPVEMEIQSKSAFEKIQDVEKMSVIIQEHNNKIKTEIENLEQNITDIKEPSYSLEDLEHIDEDVKKCQNKIQEKEKRITEINGSAAVLYSKEYVNKIQAKIDTLQVEYTALKEKLESLQEDNKYYSFIANCFSNKGNSFKKYFIGEMIDTFNEKINQFLPFLFSSRDINITFDKDLNETILDDGCKIHFESLSTGQKARTELAVSFALFNLSRVFFSNDINILLIDEILEGLDINGIKSALSILEGFANDVKVFVVSHDPNIRDSITNTITVTQDENGFSKLVV